MPGTKIYYISGRQKTIGWTANDGSIITADSVPNLDDWGWDQWWNIADWLQWHKLNVQKYGMAKANEKFVNAWSQQTFGAHVLEYARFNSSFRNYMKDTAKIWEYLYGGLATVLPEVIDTGSIVVDDAGQIITGATGGAATVGKALKLLVPVAAIGAAVWGINKYIIQPSKKQ